MTAELVAMPSPEEQPVKPWFKDGKRPAWHDDALCEQTDPEAFFPEKGGSTRDAKKICGRCNVKQECLEYALNIDERFGIWGGLSERERRRIRRDRPSIPLTLVVPSEERPPAMKDEDRFPMVHAFLQERNGLPFIVNGGDRAKVPGDLAKSAKIDNIRELRQVLRKMGRSEPDVTVSEDPDGTLWVGLVERKEIATHKFDIPKAPLLPRPAALQVAAKAGPMHIITHDEGVVAEVSEIEDLVFDKSIAAGVLLPTESDIEAELATLETPVEDINDAIAQLLLEESDAGGVSDLVLPTQRQEPAMESVEPSYGLPAFAEMPLPDGYVNPLVPKSMLLIITDERKALVLGWMAQHEGAMVHRRSIAADIAELLGSSAGAASCFISHMVARGLLGRVLVGKQPIVIWLRQEGWDWLQSYSNRTIEPTQVAIPELVEQPIPDEGSERLVQAPIADLPVLEVVAEEVSAAVRLRVPELQERGIENEELTRLQAENSALVFLARDALCQRDEARMQLEALSAETQFELAESNAAVERLQTELAQQRVKARARETNLLETVRTQELELTTIKSLQSLANLPSTHRHLMAVAESEGTS